VKFAFIGDPLAGLKPYKDSTVAMMREAERRGHEVYYVEQPDVCLRGGRVEADAVRLHLQDDDHDWYRQTADLRGPLSGYDGVLMRKDPPFDIEFITTTWLLSLAETQGARVFNHPAALREHSEKLAIAEFPQFTVPALVSRQARQINDFIDAERDVILKPLDGMGGSSIFRVHHFDPNRNVIIETLTAEGRRTVMAQRYIPEIKAGDKRILLIGGTVVPYCLARIPKAGETRGNLAAGGTGVAHELSPRDREIAEHLAPILAARGLFLVGLDVIGEHLTEINVTSPTCFVEITQQTGFSVAAAFITALEKACAA
jgi:glutathione synthase